ncbi:hypothetical protein GZ22_16065 [Terribacillus saccharophilus]|uniref:Uncharacterized protein n=1 Tax=Terribacillus saccharophilus TaxID=361277 RepID=A0A075LPU2_9BACI|nr:hypothetical protein [Terribacillus goriensis]AIF67997.1 hypothetical protein GZ22_16065 [Terribacillus goriensis]
MFENIKEKAASKVADKAVDKAVVNAADKVKQIDNPWNRTIVGGLAGASIGLLSSPNITRKIAGTFKSAKTKVKEKDLGESAKQVKDKTVHLVQDKFEKNKDSEEHNNEENQEEKNQLQSEQHEQNRQEQQDQNNNDQQDQDNQEQQDQASENLRNENEQLKQKIEDLENKLNKLLDDNSSKNEVAANSNGISIVRQDDVTK